MQLWLSAAVLKSFMAIPVLAKHTLYQSTAGTLLLLEVKHCWLWSLPALN